MMHLKEKVKKIFNQKHVMMLISMAILVIMLISATIAWFVLSRTASVNSFGGKISEWDFLISKTSGGSPIRPNETLDFKVDDVLNVKKGKMAPGTTGTIEFYIKTTTDVVTAYRVYVDKSKLSMKVDDKHDYSDILKKHIVFYTDDTYQTEISEKEPFTGTLKQNEEKKIVLYWKWPYDGSEIMPDTIVDEKEIKEYLKQYDEEDNLISEKRNYISGNIGITAYGVQEEP